MQRYAHRQDGIVREIIELPDDVDIADAMHPDIAQNCRPCGGEVAQGWLDDGETFSPPPVETPSEESLLAHARARRYAREIAGTTLNGMALRTDRETRSALTEASVAMAADQNWSTRWELPDGSRITVNAALLPAIVMAVANHRAAAFAAYDTVAGAIEAGTITSFAEVDAAIDLAPS